MKTVSKRSMLSGVLNNLLKAEHSVFTNVKQLTKARNRLKLQVNLWERLQTVFDTQDKDTLRAVALTRIAIPIQTTDMALKIIRLAKRTIDSLGKRDSYLNLFYHSPHVESRKKWEIIAFFLPTPNALPTLQWAGFKSPLTQWGRFRGGIFYNNFQDITSALVLALPSAPPYLRSSVLNLFNSSLITTKLPLQCFGEGWGGV